MPVSGGSTYTQYRVLAWEANGAAADFPQKNCVMCASPFPFGRGHVAAGSSFFTLLNAHKAKKRMGRISGCVKSTLVQ